MLKSIQSNNSPGHSHNRLPSVVDLSVDSCPGIILKRNNKMKHTKGEWVSFEIEKTGEFAIFSLNTFIAQTQNPMVNEEPTKSEKRSNAKLMASAPEMLELLKDILAEVRPEISRVNEAAGHTIFNPVATETIDMAKELIAKAEGK